MQPGEVWYIPVFHVTHPKKDKIRLVFDSSAKFQGLSLNDTLLSGPDLINRLKTVLIRFRTGTVGFAADIESMFYCFHLEHSDRNKSRFFWFKENDHNEKLIEYRGKVHLFGNTSSPALAIMGLHFAVNNDSNSTDEVKDFVTNHFYVDDGLMSTDSTEQAINILRNTQKTLSKYNIRLHKISSNSLDVLNSFSSSDLSESTISIGENTAMQQALGLCWNVKQDCLVIHTKIPDRPFTKRGILATVNSIFDPLGLVSPIVLAGKIIQRKVIPSKKDPNPATANLGWDDELPLEYLQMWTDWKKSLDQLLGLSVPRCYHSRDFGIPERREIHMFSDASLQAIGHVAYLRLFNGDNVEVALICAGSKVAPKGATTVPRLELCAAVEASLAAKYIMEVLSLSSDQVFLYSDSTVVLGYLSNTHKRFSGYVTRRINLILKQFPSSTWNYVPTDTNPADIASRPQTVSSLQQSPWFDGPCFLHELSEKNADKHFSSESLPETLNEFKTLSTCVKHPMCGMSRITERVSSWNKAKRITKIALSFAYNVLEKWKQKKNEHIAPRIVTLSDAEEVLLKNMQVHEYPDVINLLKASKSLPSNHNLSQLNPFLDEKNIIRVGGRLRFSELPYSQRFPIILPKNHPVTTSILRCVHEKVYHQGRVITLAALRGDGYFIQQGSKVLKKFLKDCVTCQRLRGQYLQQIMSELPSDRLARTPPFLNSAMDVFGPFFITEGYTTRRNSATKKLWALLFTCLASRAIHIEPLPSLDISAFRNAFRRFTCVRGPCKRLRSDKGTNFVGAFNQQAQLPLEKLEEEFAKFDVEWVFNPPKASHFGGVFERKIGSIKRIIDACLLQIGPRAMTRDELTTFLQEASSIVNHTPLSHISADPNDPVPISPATLLLQRESNCQPSIGEFSEKDLFSYASRRWRRIQYLSDVFWKKWQSDYIQSLTSRSKWTKPRRDLQTGDIVLMKDSSSKRNNWPLAKILSVKHSSDGHVRSVSLFLPPLMIKINVEYLNVLLASLFC